MHRPSTRPLVLASLVIASLVAPGPAHAQLRAPAAGPERVPVTSVRAIVLHRGDREDLVVELGYEVDAPLAEVVWVLPLPSNAEWFAAAEGDPFEGLGNTVPAAPLADVSPYAMQPLRARGAEATSMLSTWLRDGGLHALSDRDLSYYAERDWAFFLARIRPPAGGALPATARLPALHVTFRTERAIIPLRLADARGATVSITLLTATAPDADALRGARALGFDVESGTLTVAGADPAVTAILSHSSAFPMGNAPGGVLAQTTLRARSLGDAARWPEELSVPGATRREHLDGVADRELGPELPLAVAVADAGTGLAESERAAASATPRDPAAGTAAAESGSDAPSLALAGLGALTVALLSWLIWRARAARART